MDARAISPVFPQDDPILLRVNEWVPDSLVVNGNNEWWWGGRVIARFDSSSLGFVCNRA